MTGFEDVIEAWDADGKNGGERIHPFPPDSAEFWASGRDQAKQVAEYARLGAYVLDFGCGIGRLAIPLVGMGYVVKAVDSSQAMLDGLAERAAAAGVTVPSLRSNGDGLASRLGKASADVVIARAVLIHHDYEGVERIVTALAEVLRPGGHFIADWPVGSTGERRDWIGVTTWDREHRRQVAERAGLTKVASEGPSVWRKA